MRLQTRALVLFTIYLVGGALIVVVGAAFVSMRVLGGPLLVWFAAVGALQFLLLRCPACRKLSFISPNGWAALPGAACRYCQKAY